MSRGEAPLECVYEGGKGTDHVVSYFRTITCICKWGKVTEHVVSDFHTQYLIQLAAVIRVNVFNV